MFDCRLWHPVSAILLRLTRGSGFGHGAQEQEGCSIKLRDILQRQLRPGAHPDFAAFLNRLFNTLNWALTDFAVSIADLYDQHMSPARSSSTSTRLATEEQQQQRKATVMFDLTVSLLRLLEYTALNSPEAFLEPGAIELTRLMELVPFILGHFTIGADAMRLTNILNHQQQNPASRLERNILADKISRAAVLAPIMGLLLGLGYADGWKRAKETGESLSNPASSSAEVRSSFVEILSDILDPRMGLQQLAHMRDEVQWSLSLPLGSLYVSEVRSSFVEILSDILDPRMGLKQLAYMRDEVQWSSSFPLAALPRPLILHDNACSSTNSTNHAYCNGFYHQRLPAALAHFGKLCEDVEAFKVKATSKSATVARAGGATGSEGSGADATQDVEAFKVKATSKSATVARAGGATGSEGSGADATQAVRQVGKRVSCGVDGKLCEDVEAFKVKATSKSATVARAGGATGSEGSGADATQDVEAFKVKATSKSATVARAGGATGSEGSGADATQDVEAFKVKATSKSATVARAGGATGSEGSGADATQAVRQVGKRVSCGVDGKLCEDVEAIKMKASGAASKSATGAGGAAGSEVDATQEEEEGEEEIPEEFVDPITQHLMRNPVILPDSQVTLDRSTIARHLLTQAADPFSRKELSIDMVKSDDELRDRIRAWQAEQKARNQ
eukprot:gene17518-23836_t